MDPIEEFLRPVFGQPAWLVTKVHGSIITMQFGQPRLVISPPVLRSTLIDDIPELRQRAARVDGDWSLTIYLCEWRLTVGDAELAHCESDDITMARALKVVNGQQLTRVRVMPADGGTSFGFDLGVVLECRPAAAGVYGNSPSKMWWMSDTARAVTVRDDATYSIFSTTAQPDDEAWLPLQSSKLIE